MTRVIFMGTPDYAARICQALIDASDIEVVAVYTQPDKPVGRKAVFTPPPVKEIALSAHIPIYQPARLRDESVVAELLSIPCDLIIVAAYGQILPKSVIDYVPCINLHASILPQYRGASPIQQSLLNNDTQTGVSAMWMDEGLDTGAIIKIETVSIAPDEMAEELFRKLTDCAVLLTLDVIRTWDRKTVTKQDDAQATHCKKIVKRDGIIRFDNAQDIYNRYRAFTPWPGISLESGLKIKALQLEETASRGNAGEILRIDNTGVIVQCSLGSLRIIRLQAPSKQETNAADYINGKRLERGHILS